jgi:DNA-binding Lrp family transcriptional regulator
MRLSVSDIDWTALDAAERNTLEQVIPRIEDGFTVKELANELGVDAKQLQTDVDRLAAKVMALSGGLELPPLSQEEFEALVESIAEHGQQVPILRGSPTSELPGETIDGRHRRRACARLGIEPIYRDVDGTADQLRSLALVLNLARRHMSTSARRGLIRAKLLADPSQSDRSVAAAIGVSATTVGAVRRELEQAGKVSKLDTRVGRDGVAQPAKPDRSPQPPPPAHRSLRLLVPSEMFEHWVGEWVRCRSFRLAERRAGVYELEVRVMDAVAAGADEKAEVQRCFAAIADQNGQAVDVVERELLAIASEVFAREIHSVDELNSDEADWITSRAGALVGAEAS